MKTIFKSAFLLCIISIATACGAGKKEKAGELGDKKAKLAKFQEEYNKLGDDIRALEADIAKLDTNAEKNSNARLVSVKPVVVSDFSHYIDLQGHIDAENISYVSPRGMGGQVKQILIKKGQTVKKGQLLLRLDDAIVRQNLIAARQGLETIKTQLAFAKDIYQRRQNLWAQNIGSEVELITAKNNVQSLENQLKATQENVQVVAEQLNTSNVYSDVTGFVDELNVRVGETFTGSGAMGPQIKIVNTSTLKVVADIPENYLGSVGLGSTVIINVPDINKNYTSTISFSGASINSNTRGFTVEAKVPSDGVLIPNMLATVRILDYSAPKAVTVPVNVVQSDENGKYVYVMATENGKQVARKKVVVLGQVYGENAEVKGGLKGGESLITEGYQSLYDGQMVNGVI
ncbi:MAG: efflux RND transporter periplasmic adaptor subunit [Bacteroidota bacterium]